MHMHLCRWNMTDVVANGFQALRSDAWYLNNAGQTWTAVYASDPLTNGTCDYQTHVCQCNPCFNITDPALAQLVIGGEACAWGETIDDSNLMATLWPSLSAVAERLWSAQTVNDAAAALPRLSDQRCRLKRRGIRGTPLGPGYC
jgi:hexosaminidase